MIEVTRPNFEIGSLTNHGRICAYYYRYKKARWSYELVGDLSVRVFKAEDDLEVIEPVQELEPKPDFDIGDSIGNKTVAGIMQHTDCGYSYYLIEQNMETPYIHWTPQESIAVQSSVRG